MIEHGMGIVCEVPRPDFVRELEPCCPEIRRPKPKPVEWVNSGHHGHGVTEAHRNALKPSALCDLLNYVLELPRRNRVGHIVQERILPPVIASWHKRFERAPVQAWCESQLIFWGVLPKRPGPMNTSHPLVLDAWLKKPWARVA